MNARLMDDMDLDTARIRALQAIYAKEHAALVNWGRWSGDRRGIFPKNPKCPIGPFYQPKAGEVYGDEVQAIPQKVEPLEPKRSQPRERLPYEEKTALVLDERIHTGGGLCYETRVCLRVAYVTREVPESQFHKFSNCSTVDQFCERLEDALRFVKRFI